MGLSLFDRLVGVACALAAVAFYVAFAWRRMRPYGHTFRARVDALLALREPAIALDAARTLALLGWMRNTPDVALATDYLRRGVVWTDPVGVFRWLDIFNVPPASVSVLVWSYRLALAFAIVGVLGRAASALAAVLHALLWSIAYSTVGYSVHNHVVFMVLLSLALAPEPYVPLTAYVRALRARRPLATVGTYASYVRFAAAFAIATVYVQTGIEKIFHGTPRWFNGVTLQGHALRKDQWSIVLAGLPIWVLALSATVVVAWETLWGLVLLYPRLRLPGLLTAWFFHELVRYGMGVTPFSFMMTSVLFVYGPHEAWTQLATWRAPATTARARFSQRDLTSAPRPVPAPSPSDLTPAPLPSSPPRATLVTARSPLVLALVALLAAQWIPIGLRRGVYPFLGNAMFSSSLARGDLIPAEARLVVRTTDGAERALFAPEAVAIHAITFTEQVYEHFLSPYASHADKLAHRDEYCAAVLRSIQQRAEPRAAELTLWFDYFIAGELDLKTRPLATCRVATPAVPLTNSVTN